MYTNKIKPITFFVIFCFFNTVYAQVGVNTESPDETLQVKGIANTKSLFLRTDIKTNGTLTEDQKRVGTTKIKSHRIYETQIENSPQLIFPITYKITNPTLSENFIRDFDTKIPVEKYQLVVHSFYIFSRDYYKTPMPVYASKANEKKTTSVKLVAFPGDNGTWHIKYDSGYPVQFKGAFGTFTPEARFIEIYCIAYKDVYFRGNLSLDIDLNNAEDGGSGKNLKEELLHLMGKRDTELNLLQ